MPEEMLLVVDNNDNFIEYAARSECHKGRGKHHRAFVLLLYDRNKKILLQKRKSKLWDGYWDIAGASHVLHINDKNESYEEAAERCARNEWSISTRMKKLLAFNYFESFNGSCENEFCALLVGEFNDNVIPNKNYVHEHKWVAMKDLVKDMEENPKKYVPWAKIAVNEFLKNEEAKKFL